MVWGWYSGDMRKLMVGLVVVVLAVGIPFTVHVHNEGQNRYSWTCTLETTYDWVGDAENGYEVTITNNAPSTLEWSGWAVTFYDGSGGVVGNAVVTMQNDAYLVTSQSLTLTQGNFQVDLTGAIPSQGSCEITTIYGGW
jgi:hypothetical protein